ncbi:prepilin peptidase [Arthrobacter sp. JCM 19049]|uniref:prepilin peptidase n=1 Tax=Arthrobacter sp. JCM 19049 TaxID=1460643 RepID=UPI0006D1236A|nr:prepilin peptidase [Arthrobacter sp. JCM 19049]
MSLAALWTDGPWLRMAGVAYVLCFLYFGTRLSLSDIAVHRLPNRLVARWAGASAALLLLISVLRGNVVDLLWAGLGLLLLGGGYLLIAVLGRGAMGMGDVKLAGVLGLNLGYFSLGSLLLATLFAFVTASLVVLGGMLLRKLSMKSHVLRPVHDPGCGDRPGYDTMNGWLPPNSSRHCATMSAPHRSGCQG